MQDGTEESTDEVRAYRRHCRLADWHLRHGTLKRLWAYGRPTAPSMPSTLALTETQLLEDLRKARNGNGKKAEERDLLAAFGRWRGGIIMSEFRSAGNIVFLLRVADHLRQAGHFDEMGEVMRYTSNAYGFHLDTPPEDEEGRLRVAERYSRRVDLMSDALMAEGGREFVREVTDPEDRPSPIQLEEMFDE